MNSLAKIAYSIMDKTLEHFENGEVAEGLDFLIPELNEVRKNADVNDWNPFSTTTFLDHPLVELVHQDPFTRRAFAKPRGYAGDAELIDFMYGCRTPDIATTELGNEIFQHTSDSPAKQSVRERKRIIASMIDEIGHSSEDLRILSVACGHLREAKDSEAVRNRKVKQYFALDQDALSLELVKQEFSNLNVIAVHDSVKSLFTKKNAFQELDFVYSAGLYDYLSQPVAVKLTTKLFETLKSGGKLLVANFAPWLPDIGYMETFMQWNLIYRNEADVADFSSGIPKDKISSQKIFWDKAGNVIYLEIIRK